MIDENVPMTTTIRQLLADVLRRHTILRTNYEQRADAVLAIPELADIIDIAASVAEQTDLQFRFVMSAEVRALLESWRGSRPERPTP